MTTSTAPVFIDAETVDALLDWPSVIEALREGHKLPAGPTDSSFNIHRGRTLNNLSAWVDGLGGAVKSLSFFPDNPGRTPAMETIQGVVLLFDDEHGAVKAVIDGVALTRWKTVGDSLLGSSLLAAPSPKTLLVIGSGAVGRGCATAYPKVFSSLERVLLWNRTPEKAAALVETLQASSGVSASYEAATNLEQAVGAADIISCATFANDPIVQGAWLKEGQHLDLIGAYQPDMREADDDAIRRSKIYIDNREKTVEVSGELMIPLAAGVITEDDILGDLYRLCTEGPTPRSPSDITLYKNGGGAQLDLMTADLIYRKFLER